MLLTVTYTNGTGTPQTLFTRPVHPYTRKLVDAVPRVAF